MEPLLEAGGAEPEVQELLAWARESGGPSEAQLAGLSARVAPAVGLPLAALDGATGAVGTAPPDAAAAAQGGGSLSPPPPTGLGGETLVAKFAGSLLAKVSLTGLLGLGALAYVAARPPTSQRAPVPPVQAVGQPQPAPVVETRVAPPPTAPAEGQAAVPAKTAKPAPEGRAVPELKPPPERPRPSELSLIQAAQAARGRPAEMLRVLNRHARLYPGGMLGQERDVLRIEALVQLGRHRQAERRAAELRRRHPGSAHLTRVEELLDGSSGAP